MLQISALEKNENDTSSGKLLKQVYCNGNNLGLSHCSGWFYPLNEGNQDF